MTLQSSDRFDLSWCDSALGGNGLAIPRLTPIRAPLNQNQGDAIMSQQYTVLVVEDEEHIRTVIEYNLRLDGFEVFQADDGVKALKMARQIKPDLILLDWMMSDRSGLEVLADLKHGDDTDHIPVIMLTARGAESDMQRAREVGADEYITKPFAPRSLSATILRILEGRYEPVGQASCAE